MGYLLSFSIAVLLAVFTAWVQHYSWFKKERLRFESKEEEVAIELLNQISEMAHMRVYKQREQVWNLKNKMNSEIVEQDYRKAVSMWNEKIGGFMSRLEYSFSKSEASFFENILQKKFYEINMKMNLTKKGVGNAGFANLESELDILNSEIVFFVRTLMERVRRKDYSTFSLSKKVSFENRGKLTCEFLLLRLLGLS